LIQGSPPVSIAANLSFRPKQTDAFSSTSGPAKVSVCAAEKSLFVLSRSPTVSPLQKAVHVGRFDTGFATVSIAANLSFRPKQTDAFSSTFAPAKVSVCVVEKSLFAPPVLI